MAQAGVREGRTLACVASAALVVLALSSPATAAPAARPSPLLPAVRFVPGSLILPPPGPRPALRDTCGAASLAWLIGQPRSRIPVPTDLNRRRVSCTACVVAPEVQLDRLDILYDARTNRVTKISCG